MFGTEDRIVELRRRMDALEGEWLALVAEYDRSGEWQAEYLSAAHALRDLCRMDRGTAATHVHLARKTAELRVVREAIRDGEISRSHVQAIADAYTPERAEVLAPL